MIEMKNLLDITKHVTSSLVEAGFSPYNFTFAHITEITILKFLLQ